MGLAGGIVRKVFSKSPCSSAGGSRGHTEKASADHRRRWSSLRLYLCGEELNAAAEDEDEDGETVSVKSFETCCVMPEEAPHVVVPAANRLTSGGHYAVDNDNHPAGEPEEEEDRSSRQVPGAAVVVRVPARAREQEEEGAAATLIQSAFRGFMARRQLRQELRTTRQEQQGMDGGAQDQEASVATSVLVQVGECESLSLGNLRLSEEESASVVQQQQRSSGQQRPSRPPAAAAAAAAFRVKEEWDDSTVSSNVSRMRIQSRIEATTRRERALAYAFSQQLRSCGGGGTGSSKKRSSARAEEQGEEHNNVGWSWLERWMATRQAAEPQHAADDCMSRNADAGSSATAGRRVVVVRRRSNTNDLAVEEKESCGSNDVVSVVSFDGSSSLRGGAAARSGLTCHNKPTAGAKSRLKAGGRSLPRRKQVAAASDHRFQARSHKVSKKGHHRVEQAPPHKDRLEAAAAAGFGFHDACQPPTDY